MKFLNVILGSFLIGLTQAAPGDTLRVTNDGTFGRLGIRFSDGYMATSSGEEYVGAQTLTQGKQIWKLGTSPLSLTYQNEVANEPQWFTWLCGKVIIGGRNTGEQRSFLWDENTNTATEVSRLDQLSTPTFLARDSWAGAFTTDCKKFFAPRTNVADDNVGFHEFNIDPNTATATWVQTHICSASVCGDGSVDTSFNDPYYSFAATDDGRHVFFGVEGRDTGVGSNVGGVVHFYKNAGGTWTESWFNNQEVINGYFGYEVIAKKQTLFVASDENVWVYIAGEDGTLTQTANVQKPADSPTNLYDFSINLRAYSDMRFCTFTYRPVNTGNDGTMHVFDLINGVWTLVARKSSGLTTTAAYSEDGYCGKNVVASSWSLYPVPGLTGVTGFIDLIELPDPPVPPPACTVSTDCGDINQYCTTGFECASTACTGEDHSQCEGIFQSGRLPFCHKTGYCRDTKESTCGSTAACAKEQQRYKDNSNSVGKIDVTFGGEDVETQRNAVKTQIDFVKGNSTVSAEVKAYVKGTVDVSLESKFFDEVGNEEEALDAIKTATCGVQKEFCTAAITASPGARRLDANGRQLQTVEYTVTVTYDIDEDTFDDLIANNPSVNDPVFAATLAAAAGISADNVTITATGGELVVTYVLVAETNGAPLGDNILEEINSLQVNLDTVTSAIISQFNISSTDIQSTQLDPCDGRDCNGFGAELCNSNTGSCDCPAGYWGINCDATCTCLNGGSCPQNTCLCHYPYYDFECGTVSTDCSDGTCT
jgi:hypothetical protein